MLQDLVIILSLGNLGPTWASLQLCHQADDVSRLVDQYQQETAAWIQLPAAPGEARQRLIIMLTWTDSNQSHSLTWSARELIWPILKSIIKVPMN
jgi:hypothetical protein